MSTNARRILIGVGLGLLILIVLIVVVAILASGDNSSPAPSDAPTATPSPTAIPTPKATSGPTATTAPGDTPIPTATPTVVPTPIPEPTPPPSMGLGIDGDAVRAEFEAAGWFFDVYPLQEGKPTLVGHGPNDAAVQVFGPASNPTKARLFVLFSDSGAEAFFIVGFLELFAPTWPGAEDWVADNMIRSASVGELSTSHGHLTLTMEVNQDMGLMTLNLTTAQP